MNNGITETKVNILRRVKKIAKHLRSQRWNPTMRWQGVFINSWILCKRRCKNLFSDIVTHLYHSYILRYVYQICPVMSQCCFEPQHSSYILKKKLYGRPKWRLSITSFKIRFCNRVGGINWIKAWHLNIEKMMRLTYKLCINLQSCIESMFLIWRSEWRKTWENSNKICLHSSLYIQNPRYNNRLLNTRRMSQNKFRSNLTLNRFLC
jgi:hypothetical protein